MNKSDHSKNRVVVTGIGIISSLGTNIKDFWDNCINNRANVEYIPDYWYNYANFSSNIYSPLPDIEFRNYGISYAETTKLDLSTQMALVSTSMALEDAQIQIELTNQRNNTFKLKAIDPFRTGVIYGTGVGGVNTLLSGHAYQAFSNQKKDLSKMMHNLDLERYSLREPIENALHNIILPNRMNPFIVSMIMPSASAVNISIKYGINGLANTLCAACSSGTVAIGHAYRAIKSGLIDVAITGGVEYLRDDYGSIFRGFDIMGVLALEDGNRYQACRPFDKRHSGFLFSEGASATLILEDLHHALSRGAEILGEVIGFSENCDARSIVAIDKTGDQIKRMIKTALNEADLKPEDVDYINTHGTGTVINDEVEASVINDVFGKRPLINSTKSILGHTIGASGAIEAIVSLLSIKNNTTHICNNLSEPILDLNYVTEVKKYPINTAISQSFAFGGQNSVLVMCEYNPH